MDSYEPPLTIGQVERMLGIGRSSIRRAVERGELKRKGVTPGRGGGTGGHWRFDRAEVLRYWRVLNPEEGPPPNLRVMG